MSILFPQGAAWDVVASTLVVDAIDALLPQTQCTKCGYSGCRPYAEAIARGDADINQCPPGGEEGIAKLAQLLLRTPQPLNPAKGVAQPLRVAEIDEARCIGCTLCIDACPVDAIVGAAKRMHTVVPSLCTGCDLCVAPCPVDCIVMTPVMPPRQWSIDDASAARARFEARNGRLQRARAESDDRLARRSQDWSSVGDAHDNDKNGSLARQGALDLAHRASNPAASETANDDTSLVVGRSTMQGADHAAGHRANSAAVHAAVQAAQQRARARRAKFASAGAAPGEPEPKA